MVRAIFVLALACAFSSLVLCRPAPEEVHQKSKRWIFEANKDPVIASRESSCHDALSDYIAGRITMYEYRTIINRCRTKMQYVPVMHSQSQIEFNQPFQQQAQSVFMQRSRVPAQQYHQQVPMMNQWSMQPLGSVRNNVPGHYVAGFQQQQQPMFPENPQ